MGSCSSTRAVNYKYAEPFQREFDTPKKPVPREESDFREKVLFHSHHDDSHISNSIDNVIREQSDDAIV